jgi:hypothetical protein
MIAGPRGQAEGAADLDRGGAWSAPLAGRNERSATQRAGAGRHANSALQGIQ